MALDSAVGVWGALGSGRNLPSMPRDQAVSIPDIPAPSSSDLPHDHHDSQSFAVEISGSQEDVILWKK